MSLISLREVSKLYGFGDATTLALDEVSLEVSENDFIAVMGPSGCGKSTLLNMIALLDRPSHGDSLLRGRKVSKLRSGQRAKIRRDTVGFIFQSFNLLPRMTVLENVALPLLYKGVSAGKRVRAASAILERVGLREREFYYPRHLSGGQSQCAAIARALINEPSIIIADEPTGNLDSNSSRLVMELLSDIHQMGNTIIFVTHNPELTRYANRVVYMRDGAIIHDEKTVIGEVAPMARKAMYALPSKTEEDDFAGVSVLMQHVPDASQVPLKNSHISDKPKKRRRLKAKPKRQVKRSQK